MRSFLLLLVAANLIVIAGCATPEPLDLSDQPSDITKNFEEEQQPTLQSENTTTLDEEIIVQPDHIF